MEPRGGRNGPPRQPQRQLTDEQRQQREKNAIVLGVLENYLGLTAQGNFIQRLEAVEAQIGHTPNPNDSVEERLGEVTAIMTTQGQAGNQGAAPQPAAAPHQFNWTIIVSELNSILIAFGQSVPQGIADLQSSNQELYAKTAIEHMEGVKGIAQTQPIDQSNVKERLAKLRQKLATYQDVPDPPPAPVTPAHTPAQHGNAHGAGHDAAHSGKKPSLLQELIQTIKDA